MGHIPEDDNFEEYMNASAEEWSEPEEPPSKPEKKDDPTNRWGSPLPQESTTSDENRWGSEPIETPAREEKPIENQKKTKWWIIVVIVVVVLCLCACVILGALEAFKVINIL